MVGGRGVLFQPKETEEFLDVLGNETRVTVMNDARWEAMVVYYSISKNFRKAF
jgi:hypothetical protein